MKKFLTIFLMCATICFAHNPRFGGESYEKDEIDAFLAAINYAFVTGNDVLTDVTGTELETLTDSSDVGALHTHNISGDLRYLNLDEEGTNVTNGTFDLTTTGIVVADRLFVSLAASPTISIGWTANTGFVGNATDATNGLISGFVLGTEYIRLSRVGAAIETQIFTDLAMQSHLFTLGKDTTSTDIVLSFLSNANDATITFDVSTDDFLFGNANIISTGVIQGTAITDGIAILTAGNLTSAVNGTFSGILTANTILSSSLTEGRIPFVSTDGLLIDDIDMTFATDTLTVTKIGAFELTGKLTAGMSEIQGTNFDINGGTIDGVTINNSSIGSSTPSTGKFTSIVTTGGADAITLEFLGSNSQIVFKASGGIQHGELTFIDETNFDFDFPLEVTGNITSTATLIGDDLDISDTANVDGVMSIGSASPNANIDLFVSQTHDGSANSNGVVSLIDFGGTSNIGIARAAIFSPRFRKASSTITEFTAFEAKGDFTQNPTGGGTSAGNVTTYRNVFLNNVMDGSFDGTIDTYINIDGDSILQVAGNTITNAIGFRQGIINRTGTLNIGLDIADISGATTNYAIRTGTGQMEIGDDTYWVNDGSGLPYGEVQQEDEATFNVTMTTVNVWFEIDAATTNISAPELNLVTFPDDHYLLCQKAGRYLITYSFTAEINSVAGGDQHVESGIMVNDAIQTDKGIGHEQYAATNKQRNLQGHTIINIPTNGQISLAVKNTTSSGKILTIDHLNITVTQVGGT